jgi:hypothetical protein
MKENHRNVGAQPLHLDITLADRRRFRPRGMNLCEALHHVVKTLDSHFRDRHPNGIHYEEAMKSFNVMRVPRPHEIVNNCFWAGALSRTINGEKQ